MIALDGELRSVLEPKSPGAAVWANSPDRSDKGLPSLELGGRGNPRGELSLLKKLEIEQKALGGKVFDALGKVITSIKANCVIYWRSAL